MTDQRELRLALGLCALILAVALGMYLLAPSGGPPPVPMPPTDLAAQAQTAPGRTVLPAESKGMIPRNRAILDALKAPRGDRTRLLRRAATSLQASGETTVVADVLALLDSEDLSVRAIAQWALGCLTSQDFGFIASDEPQARRAAAAQARAWWEKNQASFRFGPDLAITLDLGQEMELSAVLIPAGRFVMGSPSGEDGRLADEGPQHGVTISKAYYLGAYAVTQEQYQRIMGQNPSAWQNPKGPVGNVSWHEAVAFCQKVSEKTARTVRLPTEAEWEYACRAGSRTAFSCGDDAEELLDFAWNRDNSGGTTHAVGEKQANDWGLYDMHGNVWQWCADWLGPYSDQPQTDPTGPANGETKVGRGGGCPDMPEWCRAARRGTVPPAGRALHLGFRVVVEVPHRKE